MVKHLKDDYNNFLSHTELQTRYGITVCPLKYCGTLSIIKLLWKTHQNSFAANDPKNKYESFSTKLLKAKKANKLVYTKRISKKILPSRQAQQKWVTECGIEDEECIKWHETYQLAFKCSTSTRLLEFQYKILHRRIATNEFLFKIALKDDPNCSFCKDEPEKLSHLFWSCPKVTTFWTFLIQHFISSSQIIPENYRLNLLMVLGLMPDSSKNHCQMNFCLLLARHYIWICKNKKTLPKVEGFFRYLKSIYLFEQKAAGTSQTKWELLKTLI